MKHKPIKRIYPKDGKGMDKPIDYTKAISQDDIMPYFLDIEVDDSDPYLYEKAIKYMEDIMLDKDLNWKQVIQTLSLMKVIMITKMLACKLEHDTQQSNEDLK